MTADRNPTLMQQVGLMCLHPEVSCSSASYEGTLRRPLSEKAVIKERKSDKENSSNYGFMSGLSPLSNGSFVVLQKRLYSLSSQTRR